MKPVFIDAIGLATPGMENWQTGSEILRGEQDYQAIALERYKPKFLPPNERRRATDLIRLAFKVCEEITPEDKDKQEKLASIFSSSGGDYQVLDQISKVLALPEKMVSPTLFHNSVHNSAAGYWGIATGSREASTSISAHDFSFFSGLIEAIVQVGHNQKSVQLAVYDTSPPEPMLAKRPITLPFACAFILRPTQTELSIAKLQTQIHYDLDTETKMQNTALESLRSINPAARALPLLESIANKQSANIYIKGMGVQTLEVELSPC